MTGRVRLVVRQFNHVFRLITKGVHKMFRHIFNVVDAALELPLLAVIVDPYE